MRPLDVAVAAARKRAGSAQTEDRVSVITFRVTAQERSMLEMVARVQGESLSAFIRSSVIDVARAIIGAEGGEEALAHRYSEINNENTAQMIATMVAAKEGPLQRGTAD